MNLFILVAFIIFLIIVAKVIKDAASKAAFEFAKKEIELKGLKIIIGSLAAIVWSIDLISIL